MTMAAEYLEPPTFAHVSVMLAEVVAAISERPDGVFLDVTAGGGGHSAAILQQLPAARLIACDRDPLAVGAATLKLRPFGERATVLHARFDEVGDVLDELGLSGVDGLIADLGVSSPQLDDAERGMSFRNEGPLDMRMDPTRGETAAELIERLDQDELADVIFHYGEERRSRRVARCIKQSQQEGGLATTLDLRRAVVRAVGPQRVGGVDPATRTFQALRIAVNQELAQLEGLLKNAASWVVPGGVAAFISFHSLEDRLVKRAFLDRELWVRKQSKPQIAGEAEQAENPRSRSAKLRVATRLQLP
jgi:16S rRNA (cytosine1402-N4)-methyltransferase